MSRFLENAQRIFQAAEDAALAGAPSDLTIFVGPEGGIQMIAGTEWPLDSLAWSHGARMAYRVTQQGHTVQVEGRAGSRTCLFEAETPNGAARRLLSPSSMYALTTPMLTAA